MFAFIEGQFLFLLIAAAIGVINWLTKKKDETSKPESRPKQPIRPRQGAESSEEERMRRFLEALGIPNDQKPPPPAVVKRPEAPTLPTSLPRIEPRGTVVSPWPTVVPAKRPRQANPVFTAPKKPQPAPYVPPLPPARVHGHGAPVLAEKNSIPELKTPALPVWDTVSSHVSAIPFEATHAEMRDAYKGDVLEGEALEKMRTFLKSPADLRAAILLREIIGPPRGLQTEDRLSNFR